MSSSLLAVELDVIAAEEWIRKHVEPAGPIETTHDRPWATVMRVPIVGGVTWFKACAPVQAFEPRLTAQLYARWPDRVTEVVAVDEARRWLLLGDAGVAVGEQGNPPEAWLKALPLYAELQKGEAAHALEHIAHGVPDLRMAALPAGYERLLAGELPLATHEVNRLRDYAPRFTELCTALAQLGIRESAQCLPGAMGERTGKDFRNRDPSRLVCSCDRVDPAAVCTPSRGAARVRQGVCNHPSAGGRSDPRLSWRALPALTGDLLEPVPRGRR